MKICFDELVLWKIRQTVVYYNGVLDLVLYFYQLINILCSVYLDIDV